MRARLIGEESRPSWTAPLRRLLADQRGSGELTVHLLLMAAGAVMVGLTVPSLFSSSNSASRTFQNQVNVLESGAGSSGSSSNGAGGGSSWSFNFGSGGVSATINAGGVSASIQGGTGGVNGGVTSGGSSAQSGQSGQSLSTPHGSLNSGQDNSLLNAVVH